MVRHDHRWSGIINLDDGFSSRRQFSHLFLCLAQILPHSDYFRLFFLGSLYQFCLDIIHLGNTLPLLFNSHFDLSGLLISPHLIASLSRHHQGYLQLQPHHLVPGYFLLGDHPGVEGEGDGNTLLQGCNGESEVIALQGGGVGVLEEGLVEMEERIKEEVVILRDFGVFGGQEDGLLLVWVEIDGEGVGEVLQNELLSLYFQEVFYPLMMVGQLAALIHLMVAEHHSSLLSLPPIKPFHLSHIISPYKQPFHSSIPPGDIFQCGRVGSFLGIRFGAKREFESGQITHSNSSAIYSYRMHLHPPTHIAPLFAPLATSFLLRTNKKRPPGTEEDEECKGIDSVRKKMHLADEGEAGGTGLPAKAHDSSLSEESTAHKQPPSEGVPPIPTGDILATTPLKEKYAMLLPQPSSPPESSLSEFTLQQLTLLRIQKHLDEHLFYLKTHRGKKKGQFFKSLRKNLIQGGGIIMDLLHLKQILFIDSALYVCSRELVKDHSHDVLLDFASSTESIDIVGRRVEFKEKMQKYIRSQRGTEQARKVVIPAYKFPFELEIENSNQLLSQRKEEEQVSFHKYLAKLESESIINPKNFFNPNFQFKEALDRLIESKQAKLRERQGKTSQRYGKEEVLKVVDQIFVLYNVKKVSNMFQHTLTESLSRKLLILDHVVEEIVGRLIDGEFLKKIENNKGPILQLNNKKYKECREKVMQMKFQ